MRKIAIILLLLVIAGLLGIAARQLLLPKPIFLNTKSPVSEQQFHYAYFMQKDFYNGIMEAATATPVEEKVYGGIVSHHFYAEREIAKLFYSWSQQNFKTIVVLGPNHFNAGSSDLLVSRYAYDTPWGELDSDTEVIDQLINSGTVKNEEDPFSREHSISVEVGFIKHEFPEAKIVPIIIKRGITKQAMQKLVYGLVKILPDDSLVLASVDFSHHVTSQVAKNQDKQSIDLLKNWDADAIWPLPSTQIDSPAIIYGLMKFLESRQAKEMRYWNTNQALLSGNLESQDVTSYVFASFIK